MSSSPIEAVLRALENERALDVRYRGVVAENVPSFFPNYKVMKLLSLRRQLGAALRPALAVAPAAALAIAPVQWLGALTASLAATPHGDVTVHVLATSARNVALIRGALASDATLADRPADDMVLGLRALAQRSRPGDVMRAVVDHARLVSSILGAQPGTRRDLLLHSIDAPAALLLARFLERHPHHTFMTECHYQRWSFLITTLASDARIVQHGVLDTEIPLPHSGNAVHTLYARDKEAGEQFARYYRVGHLARFSWVPPLTTNAFSSTGVFLASSFPFIDDEIAVLRSLRGVGIPAIVKLHPSHRYDGRKRVLLGLASHVCGPHEDPACRAFVSHSSSMELEYAARGIPTVSIARAGNAEAAAQALIAALRSPPEPLAKPPTTTQT